MNLDCLKLIVIIHIQKQPMGQANHAPEEYFVVCWYLQQAVWPVINVDLCVLKRRMDKSYGRFWIRFNVYINSFGIALLLIVEK